MRNTILDSEDEQEEYEDEFSFTQDKTPPLKIESIPAKPVYAKLQVPRQRNNNEK